MKTMQLLRPLSLLISAAAAFPAMLAAAGADRAPSRVEVSFFEPENFTDVRERSYDDKNSRDAILKELKTFVEERAAKLIPEGEKLSVTFTDIDMAGDFEPWRGPSVGDVRIVKDVYPPRMKLSFRLTDANGDVIKQGERTLTNASFLVTAPPNTNDPYRHEKMLLGDWLQSEFHQDHKG